MGNCNNFCNAFDPDNLTNLGKKKIEIEQAVDSEQNHNKFVQCNSKLNQTLNKNTKKILFGDKKVSTALTLSNENEESAVLSAKEQSIVLKKLEKRKKNKKH